MRVNNTNMTGVLKEGDNLLQWTIKKLLNSTRNAVVSTV
jgi:hypothetical protein